ncbi:MAG: glycine/betaine/sarcosine/D-proline family reductase selenoprotein B, partial [Candidatus Binatia bacterium]
MRVVHYLNQFFGGLGGEEKAAAPLESRNGAIGPGKQLEQLLGTGAEIVLTLICGDNYATENQDQFIAAALQEIRAAHAELVVAGPCFLAGRYGVAAGALCKAVQLQLEIPVVTGMARENPGADLFRESLYIIDSRESAAKMGEALARMARFAQKLSLNQEIGSPTDEGYIPRGLIRDQFVEKTAAERLMDMVMAKVKRQPFESEMLPATFERIPMP